MSKDNIKELQEKIEMLKEKEAAGSLSFSERIEFNKIMKQLDLIRTAKDEPDSVFVPEAEKKENMVVYVNIDDIVTNDIEELKGELKDRSGADSEKIKSLAESIKQLGLIQPVTLHKMPDGKYRKIAGWRRIEACKLLGMTKIRAIVKSNPFDIDTHNLAILHENTQREDLNPYDKVMAVLHFIKADMNLESIDDAKKACIQASNIKKGNKKDITKEDEDLLQKIENTLEYTAVFSSLSLFIKHLAILNMHPRLVEAINKNEIPFSVAEMLHRVRKKEFDLGWTYDKIVDSVLDEKMQRAEIEEFLESIVKTPSKKKNTVKESITKLSKKIDKLEPEKQERIQKEIEKLIKKYFDSK